MSDFIFNDLKGNSNFFNKSVDALKKTFSNVNIFNKLFSFKSLKINLNFSFFFIFLSSVDYNAQEEGSYFFDLFDK